MSKKCEKCGKDIPDDSKIPFCKSCKDKNVNFFAKTGATALSATALFVAIAKWIKK